jgi:uncharacterized protein YoxC
MVRGVARTDWLFGNDHKVTRAKLMGDIALLQQKNAQLEHQHETCYSEYLKLREYALNLADKFNNLLADCNQLKADYNLSIKDLTDKQKELTKAREEYSKTISKMTGYEKDKIAKVTKGGDLLLNFLRAHVERFGFHRDSGIISTINNLIIQAENLIHPKPVYRKSET